MNLSSMIGFLAAGLTLWITVIADSPNPHALLELKGMLLVIGGTFSAGLIIFPFSKLVELNKFLFWGVLLKRTPNLRQLAKEIIAAASLDKKEHYLLPICPSSHPFLTEGFKLLSENTLGEHDLQEVLNRRSQYFKQRYVNDAKMLSILAKFPSSFGMLGSTVGLIDMMSNLGKNGHDGIGPAMAMALVATFWGLVFTYMIFMPLSDYAIRLNGEDGIIRQLIVEGILMVKRGEDPKIVLDKVNGFLALEERLNFRNVRIPDNYWQEAKEEISKLKRKAG